MLTAEEVRAIVREENARLLMAACVLSRWTRQGVDVVEGLGHALGDDAAMDAFDDVYYRNDLNRVCALMRSPNARAAE